MFPGTVVMPYKSVPHGPVDSAEIGRLARREFCVCVDLIFAAGRPSLLSPDDSPPPGHRIL